MDERVGEVVVTPDLNNLDKPLDVRTIKRKVQEALKHKSIGEKQKITDQGKVAIEKVDEDSPVIKQATDRVATGINGLDQVMGGGFESRSVNIIGGGPGSGKTIFCMQYLVNGAEMYGEPGVYITFEESKEKLRKHLKEFGWDLEKLEEQKNITIIQYPPEQVEALLEEGGGLIDNAIEVTGAKRIVIDSLTAFTLLFKDELSKIKAAIKLFTMIGKWKCTALVTAEADPNPDKHESSMLEFEVDGVLLLYNIRKEDTRNRALEILKLRGIHHSTKIFPLKIETHGIEVYPEEEIF